MKTMYASQLIKGLVLTALLTFNISFSQSKYQSQLNVIFDTFITKDFQLLKPIVKQSDKKYRSEEKGIDIGIITRQIGVMPSPESYKVIETETIGDDEVITAEYQFPDRTQLYYFTFNPNGKLIGMELTPPPSL